MNFAGTTGDDDKNDGGWASVGELDSLNSLVDEVNQMVMPGVNQKMLPHEMTLTQEKQASEVVFADRKLRIHTNRSHTSLLTNCEEWATTTKTSLGVN